MCIECIAMRANITPRAVMAYLRKITKSVHVERSDDGRCRTCGQLGKTYWLTRVD